MGASVGMQVTQQTPFINQLFNKPGTSDVTTYFKYTLKALTFAQKVVNMSGLKE